LRDDRGQRSEDEEIVPFENGAGADAATTSPIRGATGAASIVVSAMSDLPAAQVLAEEGSLPQGRQVRLL
jgi:hypothetical protein